MAISIAIFDQNETFRESLKTLLNQIEGFSVVLNSGEGKIANGEMNSPFQVMLVDCGMSREKYTELVEQAEMRNRDTKALVLVMFRDELDLDFGKAGTILKSSGKNEFETRIKKLVNGNFVTK